MKQYLVTTKAVFQTRISARDDDHAWEKGEDLDVEEMNCTEWEITNVVEVEE